MATTRKIIKHGSEEHREILVELTDGVEYREIAKAHGLKVRQIKSIHEHFKREVEKIAADNIEKTLTTELLPLAVIAYRHSLIDPAMYNCGKQAATFFKGSGIFKAPDEDSKGTTIVNHNETMIVANFNSLTIEERHEFLEMARKARLALPGVDGVLASDDRLAESHPRERDLVGA